jgi:hypothetical protein
MKTEQKALLTLVLALPILTELFSGNLGPLEVFNPIGFLLQIIAYSLPILFLRELAVRLKVGLVGMYFLGVGYSFLNEGILSKTMLIGPPGGGMELYALYEIAGIHIVWTSIIGNWHAIYSVIFPLALVSLVYPSVRSEPWLSKNWLFGLGLFWVAGTALIFFLLNPEFATATTAIKFSVIIAVLLTAAWKIKTKPPFFSEQNPGGWLFWVGGLSFVLIAVTPFILADPGVVPFYVIVLWPFGSMLGLYFWLRAKKATSFQPVAYAAMGSYAIGSVFTAFVQFGEGNIDRASTSLVIFGVMLYVFMRQRKQSHVKKEQSQ